MRAFGGRALIPGPRSLFPVFSRLPEYESILQLTRGGPHLSGMEKVPGFTIPGMSTSRSLRGRGSL